MEAYMFTLICLTLLNISPFLLLLVTIQGSLSAKFYNGVIVINRYSYKSFRSDERLKAWFLSNVKSESRDSKLMRNFPYIIEHTLQRKKLKTHAFDDIHTRGGRRSVWKKWGDFQCKLCYSISGDPFNLCYVQKKRKKEISYNLLVNF